MQALVLLASIGFAAAETKVTNVGGNVVLTGDDVYFAITNGTISANAMKTEIELVDESVAVLKELVESDLGTVRADLNKSIIETTAKIAGDLAAASEKTLTLIGVERERAKDAEATLDGKIAQLETTVQDDINAKILVQSNTIATNTDDIKKLTDKVILTGLAKTKETALATCAHILAADPTVANGKYYIDPNGDGTSDAFEVDCNMDNGGITWINPTSASKEQPHQRYKQKNGAWGDGLTWFSESANHPTKKRVAYEITAGQLAALQGMTVSTSQTMSISCNGALIARYKGQGTRSNIYSNAATFRTATNKQWDSAYSWGNAATPMNPYLVYSITHDTCQANVDSILGRVDFNFVTKDVGGLPVADFRVADFGDPGEKMGAKWGPVGYVTSVRPKLGEVPNKPAKSCREILQANPVSPDGQYFVSPAGKVTDLAICDMTCSDANSPCKVKNWNSPESNGEFGEVIQQVGFTCIPAMRNVPFRNWWNGGDSYRWFSNQMNVRSGWKFEYKFDTGNLKKLQAESAMASQVLIGHCRDAIMWHYGNSFQNGLGYATRFKGYNNAAFNYNSAMDYRPLVANDEDECRFNTGRGHSRRDQVTFRFTTSQTLAMPITDYAPKDHGSSGEWTGITIGNVCFL